MTTFSLYPQILLIAIFLQSCKTADTLIDPELSEAIAWYTGSNGSIDDPRARLLLQSAASGDDPLATMWMARVYSTGRMGFIRNPGFARSIAETVIDDVERLAGSGNAEAMFLMGTAFAEGLGKPSDPVAAAQWYRQAADNGHMLAQHNLGNVYASGTGVARDDTQAVYWWRLAAQQGDAIPAYRLAVMYEQGTGTTGDSERALCWYSDAASRGYRPAIDALVRLDVNPRTSRPCTY